MIPNLVQNIGETCDPRPLLGGGAVSFDGVDGSYIETANQIGWDTI